MARFAGYVVLVVAIEGLAVASLVLATALFGPDDPHAARVFAERTGSWLGPLAGFVLCAVGGWLVARGHPDRHVRRGLTLGAGVAALDVLILIGAGAAFHWVLVASNVGRLVAGSAGGWMAGRSPAAE